MSNYLLTDKGKQKAATQLKEQITTVYNTFKELAPQCLSSVLLDCIDFDNFALHLIDGPMWIGKTAPEIDNLSALQLDDSRVPPKARIVLYFKVQPNPINLFDDYAKLTKPIAKLAVEINECIQAKHTEGTFPISANTVQLFTAFLDKSRVVNTPSVDYRLFLVVYPILQLDSDDKFEV